MEDICIRDVSKSFGNKVVFQKLNLTIKSGKTTCIMAPSGGGKTTLLRILMGLERADNGNVTGLEGRRFSAVFQEERLCEHMTAQDNVRLVTPKLDKKTVIQEMSRLGLTDCSSQRVSELSGGMCRRVSILRALLAEYDVLFLDEPFKGLDDALKEQVMAYVKEKTTGKTVLFVTHDRNEAFTLGAEVIELV
ncbi:MAG: ATP-binding cassette domain-containing protein [Lachnospiraceae bacterium]|nr:ATP-binding cassette domain-containing protein [Lachnospiraceae bacterium]